MEAQDLQDFITEARSRSEGPYPIVSVYTERHTFTGALDVSEVNFRDRVVLINRSRGRISLIDRKSVIAMSFAPPMNDDDEGDA